MKKKILTAGVAVTLCASLTLSSCIGSFGLSNKVLSWNKQVGNKFVNELVFFAFWILPVYEVTILADALVINSIEFWSGSNPMACGKKVIEGNDGRYLVEVDPKGYTITSENDGSTVRLDYDEADRSWDVTLPATGETYELMTFVDDTHVSMPMADGTRSVVPLTAEGVLAYGVSARTAAAMASAR